MKRKSTLRRTVTIGLGGPLSISDSVMNTIEELLEIK